MNEAQAAAGIVSTVGFPIAACLLLGFFVYFLIKRSDAQIEKLNEQHSAEMKDARQEYAQQIRDIMQQHKEENEETRQSINRIADGLQDVRELIRQIIAPAGNGLKPPDDSWNE